MRDRLGRHDRPGRRRGRCRGGRADRLHPRHGHPGRPDPDPGGRARAGFSPAGVIENLAVVVALPLAAGIALRSWPGPAARALATARAETAASRTALAAVAALVALVAAEVHLSASYAAVAGALALFLAASVVLGRALGARSARPTGSALLLTTSMRDFAIAAALAAAAFGPQAAAPLGLYGIVVLIWGTAAGALRARAGMGRGHTARFPRPCSTWPRPAMLVGDQPHRRGQGTAMGPELSYTSATSDTPLLGDTIGGELRPHGRQVPRPPRPGRRPRRAALHLRGAERRGRRPRVRPARAGHRQGRPRRHLVAEPGRVDRHPVRHRQDRRDPGQHQPRLPHQRA